MAPKQPAKRLPQRGSIRGAFGPAGALNAERRRSSGTLCRAQIFQLDRCLDAKEFNKIIYQFGSAAEARKTIEATPPDEALEYDVRGFVVFLARSKALSTLLFWKDAEEFQTLFGGEERAEAAKKIFKRYLEPGAEFEVASLQGDHLKDITSQLSSPPEDLFENLQQQAYGSMLFELFPRFWEEVKTQDREGKKQRSKLNKDTKLLDVIRANDLEVHLFAEYCREHLCEDCVIFLLECQMFSLLFDPTDLLTQGQRIYSTYLDPSSEGRIVVSATKLQAIEALVKPTDSPDKEDAASSGVTTDLFAPLVEEVANTLNMDVWPRYKDFVLEGGAGKPVGLQDIDATSFVDMTKPSKKAVAAALRNPVMTEHLRKAAEAQGVKETIDFCQACMSYKLLFSDADRRPRATLIHDTYLKAGCDTPVNVPHTMIIKVEENLSKCESDLFEACLQEMLQVISDNIYTLYLKDLEKAKEAEAAEAAAKPAAAPSGGGCCLVM